jgi:hypothetical protein
MKLLVGCGAKNLRLHPPYGKPPESKMRIAACGTHARLSAALFIAPKEEPVKIKIIRKEKGIVN